MTDNNVITTDNGNYEVSKYNAMKHGILSKYTVMQWESSVDYENLLDSLVQEHDPEGATELHLVEELAGVVWRKMRLRYAEMTSTQANLNSHIQNTDSYSKSHISARAALLETSSSTKEFDIKQAVVATEQETQEALKQMKQYLACWKKARKAIEEMQPYEKAFAALHKEDQHEWNTEYLGERVSEYSERVYEENSDSLHAWIIKNIPYYEARVYELENREKIKKQVLGQSFLAQNDLNKFTRYENHLDRKFEKTLAMLIKLQELRGKDFVVSTKLA